MSEEAGVYEAREGLFPPTAEERAAALAAREDALGRLAQARAERLRLEGLLRAVRREEGQALKDALAANGTLMMAGEA